MAGGKRPPKRSRAGVDGVHQTDPVSVARRILLSAAEAMRGWTPADLDEFLRGDRDLVVRAVVPNGPSSAEHLERLAEVASEVRQKLDLMDSRDQGMDYLNQLRLSRDDLRRLVLALDLPMSHSDNMERLRSRIVEALIGYRLRSNAIRGTDVRASPREPHRKD